MLKASRSKQNHSIYMLLTFTIYKFRCGLYNVAGVHDAPTLTLEGEKGGFEMVHSGNSRTRISA